MEFIDIIIRLIGNINPVGETNIDNERLNNLKIWIDNTDDMISELKVLSENKNSSQRSVSRAGKLAQEFLDNLAIELKEYK